MPRRSSDAGRDPLSVRWDTWARELLEVLRADPWEWHGRTIIGGHLGDHGRWRLSDQERAVQRSLYWNINHAASSGALIRPSWSLAVAWGPPLTVTLTGPHHGARSRLLSARVMPRSAGRRFYAGQRHE